MILDGPIGLLDNKVVHRVSRSWQSCTAQMKWVGRRVKNQARRSSTLGNQSLNCWWFDWIVQNTLASCYGPRSCYYDHCAAFFSPVNCVVLDFLDNCGEKVWFTPRFSLSVVLSLHNDLIQLTEGAWCAHSSFAKKLTVKHINWSPFFASEGDMLLLLSLVMIPYGDRRRRVSLYLYACGFSSLSSFFSFFSLLLESAMNILYANVAPITYQ